MIELPEPLLKAMDEQKGQPLPLRDPRTNVTYLLVRADVFERIDYAEPKDVLDKIDVGALIERNMREFDEEDPTLESYQQDPESAR